MALPSAQLGQMPTMQMPYNIPVVPYTKEPKAWEKALLTILASTGSAAATQGIQNVMSPDYAAEFGQTPRSGLSRLLNPVVGTQQAESLREQEISRKLATETGRHNIAEEGLTGQNIAQTGELGRGLQQTQRDVEGMRAASALDVQAKQAQAAQKLQELAQTFQLPYQQAQIGQLGAATGEMGAQTSRLGAETAQLETARQAKEIQNYMMIHNFQFPKPTDLDSTGKPFSSQALVQARAQMAEQGGNTSSTLRNPGVSTPGATNMVDPKIAKLLQGGSPGRSYPTAEQLGIGKTNLSLSDFLGGLGGAQPNSAVNATPTTTPPSSIEQPQATPDYKTGLLQRAGINLPGQQPPPFMDRALWQKLLPGANLDNLGLF